MNRIVRLMLVVPLAIGVVELLWLVWPWKPAVKGN